MMRFWIISLLLLINIGCSDTTPAEDLTRIEPDQVSDILFHDHSGRATIIYDSTRGIDFVVWMNDLDPDKEYEIVLVRNHEDGGVLFGPKENLDIKLGSIEEETKLRPNSNGELYVSMLNPERLFEGTKEVRIEVMTFGQKEVVKSYPFQLSDMN